MTNPTANQLIQDVYAAFNDRDTEGFLGLLTEDVVHEVERGGRQIGKAALRAFIARTARCYEEKIVDLFVMTNAEGTRAAAEFTLLGVYVESDDGLPPAEGQRYSRPAGAIFEIRDGKVSRMSDDSNPTAWLGQDSLLAGH